MRPKTSSLTFVSLIGLASLIACGPQDPIAKVAQTRADYTVKLNSWRVVQPEVEEVAEPDAEMADGEMADAEAADAVDAGEVGDAGEGEAIAEIPTEVEAAPSTVLFDLLVRFNGTQALPGITLDITQADPFEKEKDHRRHWIDTSAFQKASLEQVSFELGGFDFEDGDVFSVELVQNVPAELRGEYREFAEAGR